MNTSCPGFVKEAVLPSSPGWYSSHVCDGNEAGMFVCASRNNLMIFQVDTVEDDAITPSDVDKKGDGTRLNYQLLGMIFHAEKVVATSIGPRTKAAQKDDSAMVISGTQEGTVCVWEATSRKLLHSHQQKHKGKVMATAWSLSEPDWIVTGDERGTLISYRFGSDPKKLLPEKSCINCLSFCPHDHDLLAVGYQSGAILLIKMSGKKNDVKKLLGHNDDITSLVWCPESGNIFFNHQNSSSKDGENPSASEEDTYILASGSKDQLINFWAHTNNHSIYSIKVPQTLVKREKAAENGRLWIALHWPKHEPKTLISGVQAGTMVSWDLAQSGRKKYTHFETSVGCAHNRAIFGIASLGSNVLCTISQDRNLIFWDLNHRKSIQSVSTFGGYVYALHAVPLNPDCLAIGVGDNTIRIWNRQKSSSNFMLAQIWQRIKSKVTAVQWHPVIEGLLAYGTEDGRVGTVEANTQKPPVMCWSFHTKTVYTVEWGKATFIKDSETENLPLYTLYSQGDGMILQNYYGEKDKAAVNINSIILVTNGKKECSAFPARTEIKWKPDFSMVAIGNEDGSVEIFSSPHLKMLCIINVLSKIINCISWHPSYTTNSTVISSCSAWLALGSNGAVVPVIDLSSLKKDYSTSTEKQIINDSFRSLEGHSSRVTGLCWSSHFEGLLATVSYDKTAMVWNVKTGEAMARYMAHVSRLICVSWSLTDSDIIYTGSEDCCLHVWRISLNKCNPNICVKKSLKIKRRSKSKKTQDSDEESEPKLEFAENRNEEEGEEMIDRTALTDNVSPVECVNPDNSSTSHEEHKINIDVKPSTRISSEYHEDVVSDEKDETSCQSVEDILGPELMTVSSKSAKPSDDKSRTIDENKSKKLRKYRKSMFPLCSKLEQGPREKVMRDIVNLTKKIFTDPTFELGDTDFYLGFFLSRKDMYLLLEKEGQFHLEHDNMEYHLHMEIWKGNINKALNNAKERDELSDWLVAMAPLASHATWLSVCEDYAHQLESDGQYHKAATYLMACHRNYDAIALFKRHRLYKEAVAFAKIRLSPFDPVFEDLYSSWAQQLAKEGNYEQAAKCFLAIKQVKDASQCLTKRNDPVCLRTAAHISLLASEKQNGFLLAYKVVCQYLQKMQYQEIYNFTQEHHSLRVFTLVASIHELMMTVLASLMPDAGYVQNDPRFVLPEIKSSSSFSDNGKTQLPDFILDSCDMDPLCPWKPFLINNHTFLNYVLRVWHTCLDIDISSSSSIEEMYNALHTLVSNRQNLLKTDQLLIQNCIELTLCLLALLQAETTSAIKHLLQTLSSFHDVGQFELLQVTSQLCLPQGPKYFLKLQQEVTAIRVLVSLDKNGDDVSKLDSTLKLNTTKRYLSEIKENNGISNATLRCRELDCVRAYYYIGVLQYLRNRQNSESTLIPSQNLPKIYNNNKTLQNEGDISFNQMNLLGIENSEWVSNQGSIELNNNNNNNNINNINNTDANDDNVSISNVIDSQNSSIPGKTETMAKTDYKLDFHKIKFLSKCILWNIQGKRFCLTEKLGYIHKAISRLLLEQKPQDNLGKSVPISSDVGATKHSVKYVNNNSSSEMIKMTGEGPVPLQQDAVRLQAPDVIPMGHETSPAPTSKQKKTSDEESEISSPQIVKELLSKDTAFSSSSSSSSSSIVSSALFPPPPPSHCTSPCREDDSCRSITKPRKILWKDEPPVRSVVCPLHKKYINVPDSWYDLPVDEKYSQHYINMGILLNEQDSVMTELKQGPENPSEILFPHPLSTAQLLLNVIWKSEDFDRLEKFQLLEDILSWSLEYSCTREQQRIFQSLKEQIHV